MNACILYVTLAVIFVAAGAARLLVSASSRGDILFLRVLLCAGAGLTLGGLLALAPLPPDLYWTLLALRRLLLPIGGCMAFMYADYFLHRDEAGLARRLPYALLALLFSLVLIGPGLVSGLTDGYPRMAPLLVFSLFSVAALVMALHRAVRTAAPECLSAVSPLSVVLLGAAAELFFGSPSALDSACVCAVLVACISVQLRLIKTDELTGLNNRRQLNVYLSGKLSGSDRGSGVYCLLLDLDGFKHINDTFGHAEGDRALVAFSAGLKKICHHSSDFVARLGGDEFVLIAQRSDPEQITELCTRIRNSVRGLTREYDLPYELSASIGCVCCADIPDCTPVSVIKTADAAMYAQKLNAASRRTGAAATPWRPVPEYSVIIS